MHMTEERLKENIERELEIDRERERERVLGDLMPMYVHMCK